MLGQQGDSVGKAPQAWQPELLLRGSRDEDHQLPQVVLWTTHNILWYMCTNTKTHIHIINTYFFKILCAGCWRHLFCFLGNLSSLEPKWKERPNSWKLLSGLHKHCGTCSPALVCMWSSYTWRCTYITNDKYKGLCGQVWWLSIIETEAGESLRHCLRKSTWVPDYCLWVCS